MSGQVYLAIDLGAESGRVIAGLWNGRRITLEEVHRFPNGGVLVGDSLRWDVVRLWSEIQIGLSLAAKRYGKSIVSVGADTWGVDYVLLSKEDEMLGQPYCYRDARTEGVMDRAFKKVSRAEIFSQTGLQFLPFNTLFQLMAHRAHAPRLLRAARRLLFMPDFLHWCLCGSDVAEYTIASTSQCLNPMSGNWARPLMARLGLPTHLLPRIVPPGTALGAVRTSVRNHTGLGKVRVVAPPSHDTASAVAAVPTAHTGHHNWAYLSSGTWSLMGVEHQRPLLNPRTLKLEFTNEGGVDGTVRLLKNIMGLWLVQRCKRAFDSAGREHSYAELASLGAKASPLRSLVNPNDARFLNPPDMPAAIQQFCRETGQPVPRTKGQIIRCAKESLALKYGQVTGHLEQLTNQPIEVVHIVGGGSQDTHLNQMTADACQRPVLAGPVEATALGNLLTQVRARGELASLAEMREVVRRSTQLARFAPRNPDRWLEAAKRFDTLTLP